MSGNAFNFYPVYILVNVIFKVNQLLKPAKRESDMKCWMLTEVSKKMIVDATTKCRRKLL